MKAEAALRRRVERLMVLDLFSDWPTQELGFFARWMTELALPEAVSHRGLRRGAPASTRGYP